MPILIGKVRSEPKVEIAFLQIDPMQAKYGKADD
jgi:hypothetical protein